MMMVREADEGRHNDNSLILALLQERFRQLQRMKELRQEKELLSRTLYESEKHVPSHPPPPTKQHYYYYCYHYNNREMFDVAHDHSPQPSCQLSLSLWPESNYSSDKRAMAPSPDISKLSPVVVECSGTHDVVDTSLRL